MGMGYAGASAYVIKDGKVEELCPDEYAALVGALKVDSRMADEDGISQYEEAELVGLAAKSVLMWDGGYRKLDEPTQAAWLALKEKFNEVTGGLELGVSYHDSEAEGSRYDEVDGYFWIILDGLYDLTPAGKAFAGNYELKNFVEFC